MSAHLKRGQVSTLHDEAETMTGRHRAGPLSRSRVVSENRGPFGAGAATGRLRSPATCCALLLRRKGLPDAMAKITFIQPDGKQQVVDAAKGLTVMEAAKKAAVPGIEAECGGACACATCHVYVDDGWYEKLNPPSPEELDMLDMALAVEANSRLSCQIPVNATTDGIKVTIAPE